MMSTLESRWCAAAAAGILSGIGAGCASPAPTTPAAEVELPEDAPPATSAKSAPLKPVAKKVVAARDRSAEGCCAGRNDCKGKGNCKVEGAHECRGMNECKAKGGCASDECPARGKSCCKGMNDCKGLGGCKTDQNPCKGQNPCKTRGGCAAGTCH